MQPRAGQSLKSTVDTTTVIVVRAPEGEVSLTCGGAELVDPKGDQAQAVGTPDPSQMTGALLGKRYANEELGLELLCTKAGTGTLAANGTPLPLKAAKPLPASD